MKKIDKALIIISFIVIGFNACSDKDSGINNVSSGTKIINIETYCVQNTTLEAINTYVTMQNGDILVDDEDGTVVEIYHDENDNKNVCLINGSAHILRSVK